MSAAAPEAAGAAPRASIEARELTRRFGPHTAVDRLSLRIPAYGSYGLLGANGAGKTTFIRLVAGFLLPTAGSVEVEGLSPALHPTRVQARLGFVMETSRLYPELRVRGFLRFMGGARGLAGDRLRDAVERCVARFGLGPVVERRVGNLSKGFQQRVSLAQAFLHDPPLVIVDEPGSGLDPVQRAEVHAILGELRGDHTIVICTHDLAEAELLTSRVAVLAAGRLLAEGPTREVLGRDDALALFRPGEGGP